LSPLRSSCRVSPRSLPQITAISHSCRTLHSVGLVAADHPVDAIWRAVLPQDDAAMTAIDLAAGPVWLTVERNARGVEVLRLSEPEWRFMSELCASRPLQEAIDATPEIDAASVLASHLAAGRFIRFALSSELIQIVN
jgi:hypothetical protein